MISGRRVIQVGGPTGSVVDDCGITGGGSYGIPLTNGDALLPAGLFAALRGLAA